MENDTLIKLIEYLLLFDLVAVTFTFLFYLVYALNKWKNVKGGKKRITLDATDMERLFRGWHSGHGQTRIVMKDIGFDRLEEILGEVRSDFEKDSE